jgi:hypothetical protein
MGIEVRHICSKQKNDYLIVNSITTSKQIRIGGVCGGNHVGYIFDISTAIKFAKTLRTEINKAKEGGQDNG